MDAISAAQHRAAEAERAVRGQYVRHLGPIAWARAAAPGGHDGSTWHYWWHAHLLDALGDAQRHRPHPGRRRVARAIAHGVTLRTAGRWVNAFYDDIAWMGLALARTRPRSHALARIVHRLERGIDPEVGALPWAVGSDLYNAPANGPAAILLARTGRRRAATGLTTWIATTLDDPDTGLVRDGVEPGRVRPDLWTYNQGTAIGAALALGDTERAANLVAAVDRWCAPDDGLFPAPGGGDGGLFAGILARYLAQAAHELDGGAAATATRLVRRNAEALWATRLADPRFSADPRRRARHEGDDLDLSVQLGAWITFEAAVDVEAAVTS